MKSICFITTGDIKAIATAKRALGLANYLSDLGWKVSILMEDTKENHRRISIECDNRTKVCYFPSQGPFSEIASKNKFLKIIKPDIAYICTFIIRNFVSVPKGTKVITENCELPSVVSKWTEKKKIIHYLGEYFSLFFSDGIVNASVFLQEFYKKRLNKVHLNKPLLYSPYAYNSQICIKLKSSEIKAQISRIGENAICFTYLGSISKAYGSFTMVKAVELLRNKNSKVKLLLLGQGDDMERIKQYITEHRLQNIVYMPGYIEEEDVAQYFAITNCFLLPMRNTLQDISRCPSKLYMYIPYLKPIITSKVGEPYHVLGPNGYYYEDGSSDSLAAQMEKVIKDGMPSLNIKAEDHEWRCRTLEFDKWLKEHIL